MGGTIIVPAPTGTLALIKRKLGFCVVGGIKYIFWYGFKLYYNEFAPNMLMMR